MKFSDRPFQVEDAEYVVAAHRLPHVKGFVGDPPSIELVVDTLVVPNVRRSIVLNDRRERAGLWMAKVTEGWLVEIGLIIAQTPKLGVGRFAVRSALRWAFDEIGAHRVGLEVLARNIAARSLYESEGFVLEGTYRDGFRRGDGQFEDLLYYSRLSTDP